MRSRGSNPVRPARQLSMEQLESRHLLTVVISEFLASNERGIRDASGERHDWIELSNTGAVAEDLSGWYLTDDALNPTKFELPSAGALSVLDPGERLLIFASGNNGQIGLVNGEVHTNFRLSQEPAYLGLIQNDGSTVEYEYNLYPQQTDDVSYGTGIDIATLATASEALVGDSSPLTVISPTGHDAARDDHWKKSGFDDSGWLTGTGSVGFDRNSDSPDLTPFIGRVLTPAEMDSNSSGVRQYSAYVRYEFDVASPEQLTSLSMDLRFDDGFIAFLNGKEIARANFAEDFVYPQPQWNSYAGHQQGTSSSSGNWNRTTEADQAVSFELSPYLELLNAEDNVLAFHGVNSRSGGNGAENRLDWLLDAELVAGRAVGATQVGFMDAPSPGRDNGVAYDGFIEDTAFSVDRGIYDSAQSVAITTDEPGTTIRYTTDFSEPTLTNGTTYTAPLSVSSTTVLRAAAFKNNFIPTNVDTQSYIFPADVITQSSSDITQPYATWGHDKDGDNDSGYNLDDEADWDMDPDIVTGNEAALINALQDIPSLSVVTDWDNLWSGTPLPGTGQDSGRVPYEPQGIYIHGRSSERPNSLEYFTADGSEEFQVESVIEIQGHSSPGRWKTDKLSFQVKFKSPLADPKLNFSLFTGTADEENATDEFDTLILDAGYNYGWTHANLNTQSDYARFVTDQVTADLQNLASGGGGSFHGKYVHLYLDSIYWGIYNVHERPDEHYAREYFGSDDESALVVKHSTNDIDQIRHTWVNGGLTAEQAFEDLLDAAREDLSVPANYEAIAQTLEIDQFIDYMIVHMYAGNKNDWPHNNWYGTYDPSSPSGKWRFHAWDQEHAFPTDDNGDQFDQFVDLTDFDLSDNDDGTVAEIFLGLVENDEFRLRFSDRAQALLRNDGVLTPAAAQATYEARTDEIDQAILGESARWGDNWRPNDPYTRADFINTKNGVLNDFFPVRTSAVLSQFDAVDWLVDDAAPEFNQYGGDIAAGFNLTMTNPNGVGTIYYTLDGSDPRDSATNGPSASAIAYTGAVALSDSVQVRARVFANSTGVANDWSAEIDKVFTVIDSATLRIVELMYHPTSGDTEYIELLNIGDGMVDLTDVQITDFSSGGYTFGNGTLAPGERIVVPENVAAFTAKYPGVTNVTSTAYAGSLSNGGELIVLRDPFGNVLQSFTYDDSPPWPTTPDGGGYSLEYVGPLDGGEDPLGPGDPYDSSANWQASDQLDGSPGTGATVIDPDFNDDGFVDGIDIDMLQENLINGPQDPTTFDLTGDGFVTIADRDEWLAQAGAVNLPSGNAYLLGDANLDGNVDGQDFVVWNNNKFTPSTAWTEGDFSANGVVDGGDFVVWNDNKFQSAADFARTGVDTQHREEAGDDEDEGRADVLDLVFAIALHHFN